MKITINDLMINSLSNIKKMSLQKSAASVAIIGMLLLNGCGQDKDEIAPVISNAFLTENVITVEATDNKEIVGYAITTNPRKPSADSTDWQKGNTFPVTEDDEYYVWVIDAAGNVTGFSESIKVATQLAEKFDHINWLTPATGTKVVDGVTYDLADLKAQYGDLYRLVEPLTKEEIESRFAYLAEFIELQMEEAIKINDYYWYPESGLKMNNAVNDILSPKMSSLYENVINSKDSKLSNFEKIYFYSSATGKYETTSPLSFTSSENNWRLSTEIIDKIPFEDKNIFLRDVTMRYEIQLKIYSELNIEPEYAIENWNGLTK